MRKLIYSAIFPISFSILLICSGCEKAKLETGLGQVINTGSFSSGGCEWVIELNFQLYEPRNLSTDFQVDGLPVEVTYKFLRNTVDCPNAQDYAGRISIHKIKRL